MVEQLGTVRARIQDRRRDRGGRSDRDNHLQVLWWQGADAVGHDDLTAAVRTLRYEHVLEWRGLVPATDCDCSHMFLCELKLLGRVGSCSHAC